MRSSYDGSGMKSTGRHAARLLAVLLCSSSTRAACGSTPAAPTSPTPSPPVSNASHCPAGPDGFQLILPESPYYVGLIAPQPDLPTYPSGQWPLRVCATGQLRGTIQSIDRSLRDRATGQVLGTAGYPGFFVFPIKGGLVNPLLDSGYQDFTLGFDSGPNRLGFAG